MPKKAKLNAFDALVLLNSQSGYNSQLRDIIRHELRAHKILCISDTTDLVLQEHEKTTSTAYRLQNAELGPHVSLTQTDYIEFQYAKGRYSFDKFGAHLPQQATEPRREYVKLDSTQISEDLGDNKAFNIVIGRRVLCACLGEREVCGGIEMNLKKQADYLQSLMALNPSIVLLSGDENLFSDDAEGEKAREFFIEAKENWKKVCDHLNAQPDNQYRLAFIPLEPPYTNPTSNPSIENGYMVVAYHTARVSFELDYTSLEPVRRSAQTASSNHLSHSLSAFIRQHKLALKSHKGHHGQMDDKAVLGSSAK